MQFNPAIAAQGSLAQARQSGELGDDLETALAAEETFSSAEGDAARAAYETLQQFGERHPNAKAYQEFLIYTTWQQVSEETIPVHFRRGLELCDRYLRQHRSGSDKTQLAQIHELRGSFRAGLGLEEEDDETDYEKDVFAGGD